MGYNWKVTAYWKYEYKNEVTEKRKKVWKNILMVTAKEAISVCQMAADVHGERWPADTKWTAKKEKE